MTEVTHPFVAIQVSAESFVDEGVSGTLDTFQERAGVNALFLATPTWGIETGGRQLPGFQRPDHGRQDYEDNWEGGSYVPLHPEFYWGTRLGPLGRATQLGDWDMFEAVLPEARSRGMKSYAWMNESSREQALRNYPGFTRCLEVDPWGRPAPRPCFNNPEFRNWHLALAEDYVKSYPLDGVAWISERPGPLNLALQGPVDVKDLGCFCTHCRDRAKEIGIDWMRAREGWRWLYQWNRSGSEGQYGPDGPFVELWRLLLKFPEILGWQRLWTEGQHQMYKDIYGTVKAVRRDAQVGWHIYHWLSFNPFYRACEDFDELAEYSDFLKVVTYNNCAGPRFYRLVEETRRVLFGEDVAVADAYAVLAGILGYKHEASYEDLPARGFSTEYIRGEIERVRRGVSGRCNIYAGIDIDIPVTDPRQGGPGEPAGAAAREPLTSCSRSGVRDAVLAAFEGGAEGVVLSRKYSEMFLEHLAGAGDALRGAARAATG